jgi:6-phosphofructokinase 1
MKLFQDGVTGCMVTADPSGNIAPLFLKDVEDKNGKVKPRLVNIDSELAQLVYHNNLQFITKNDYKEAKKYLSDPEEYDFYKILNW